MNHSMKNIGAIALLCFLFIGCKKNTDLFKFDTTQNSLYFGYEPKTINSTISNSIGIDSLTFSFALVPISQETYVFKVPVLLSGVAKDYDRKYNIEVVNELTTLPSEFFTLGESVISKGKYTDTLEVNVRKHDGLRSKVQQLALRFKANEEFGTGYMNNQIIRLQVTDILLQPNWWSTWEGIFGDYSQEKYQMWAIIYHEKADGYLDYTYNYKNMPSRALQSWYPTTFVFIQQLKSYFEKNVIYPNGDESRPKISIPYQF